MLTAISILRELLHPDRGDVGDKREANVNATGTKNDAVVLKP